MLSLLSKMMIGGGGGELNGETDTNDDDVFVPANSSLSSSSSAASGTDTDEEMLEPQQRPPIINIDQTEVGEDALVAAEEDGGMESVKQEDNMEVEVDEETAKRIVELVEYYLSDDHLVRDMFLLKHVTRHREGYVSVKLLTAYKKMKRVAQGWRVVSAALVSSQALQLSPDRSKVRRRDALPPHLHQDTRPFRTVLAAGLDPDTASMISLAEVFGKFGEVTAMQLHRPGGRALPEVRQAEQVGTVAAGETCVLVEYDKVHQARHAIKHISTQECGMRPVELPRSPSRASSRASPRPDTLALTPDGESAYYSNSDFSEPSSPLWRPRPQPRPRRSPGSSLASSASPSPLVTRRRPRPHAPESPESSPPSPYLSRRRLPTPGSSPEGPEPRRSLQPPGSSPLPRRILSQSQDAAHRRSSIKGGEGADMLPMSPWLRRRVMAAAAGDAGMSVSMSSTSRPRHDTQPNNIIRFPRGPDGTRGFTQRRLMVVASA